MSLLSFFDFAAVLIFALTGALTASRAQLDLVGFAFLAALTGVGGGTVRDVLLDRNPVFWIEQPAYLAVTSAAALLVFFTAHLVESRYRLLLWLDALALGVAVAAGIGIALAAGQPAIIAVLMGIVTGCMGGLMRDVVCNEVPLVLKQGELYVSAAFAGASAGVIAAAFGLPSLAVLSAAIVVTVILRAGSLAFGWRLPVYRSAPPRR
ncbi:trimeric intracellular cation channel family protein [Planktotalea arctica]|uniref:trimeric intracellular cation channel family protein n=1 Tax=Planktotalea arctica TaxID=1481893 RepID=UPI000A1764CD|nr:trimeric intracellular cation channel family protein [Planktotalea arctica]